ncbi:MAG: lysylphosphatidylglycerol synthase transmembrane domain-containing protein [Candidatus Neomarinimicrobiota bacterium]
MKKAIVGAVISLAALWWAFRGLDWIAFKAAIAGADLFMILVSVSFLMIGIPVRAYRWGIFLHPVHPTSLILTSEATLVGYFGNNALPFRLGELLRTYFLQQQIKVPFTKILGTVIVERLIDAASLVLLVLLLPLAGVLPPEFQTPARYSVAVALLAILVLVVLTRGINKPVFRGRLGNLLENFKAGFASLRNTRHYPILLVTSVSLWLFYLLSGYFALNALGLGITLGQAYLVLVVGSLAIAIPATPGFVGTYHAGIILLLTSVFHLELPASQAAAVVLHAVAFIPATLIGGIIYFKSHLRIREVKDLSWEDGPDGQ